MRTILAIVFVAAVLLGGGCVGYCLRDEPLVEQVTNIYPQQMPAQPAEVIPSTTESNPFAERGTFIVLPEAIVLEEALHGGKRTCEKGGVLTICAREQDRYMVVYLPPQRSGAPPGNVYWIPVTTWEQFQEQTRMQPLLDTIANLQEALKGYEVTVEKNANALRVAGNAIQEANAAIRGNEASINSTNENLQKIQAHLAALAAAIRENRR
ncbi:MAG: hypothetical protein AAB518_01225 [Patescibacteria group bacterium]